MFKTEDSEAIVEVEYIGKGKLVWVPSIVKDNKNSTGKGLEKIKKNTLKEKVYNLTVSSSMLSYIAKYRFANKIRDYYRNIIDNDIALNIFEKYDINLLTLHWIALDSEIFVERALQKQVPFIIINHFDNQRYNMFSMKRQILKAVGFAGVSSINIPHYIRNKFVNLSDSIDTDYFDPEKARPLIKTSIEHFIFLPSRITPEKGHLDAIRAIDLLNQEGIDTKLVFAGICHEQNYMQKLHEYIEKSNLKNKVIFAGQLNIEDLRDYYAASDIVILPSYSEGLGRVLLEAQAMKKPVVAYNTGGIPEAMQNGKTGYMVTKGNYRDLAVRLREILTNDQLKTQMGESARDFILNKFNFSELTIRHENFYIRALNKHNKGNCTSQEKEFRK
jgi:glycosyltransferase involved in cell wall biosynthesis